MKNRLPPLVSCGKEGSGMRRLFMFNMMTLDGFFEGPDRDISWHRVDAEFNAYAVEMLDAVDVLLFGRVTYELMARYWPTPEALKDDPLVAGRMNRRSKIVFSRTLEKADWNNTRLIKDRMEEEILRLKQEPGRDLVLLGSGKVASQLGPAGLIDEYRVMVNPVVLGRGTPLFSGINERLHLRLLRTRTFGNGNVLLNYEPAGKER